MARHMAPTVAIELLFLAYLFFGTNASRTTFILATELVFFVHTISHCVTQTWLSLIGPPTTRSRRVLRTTVGVVLPSGYTLVQIFSFLNHYRGHAGDLGYVAEKPGVSAGIQVSTWNLLATVVVLLYNIIIHYVATRKQPGRQAWGPEVYNAFFLFITVVASTAGFVRMQAALPYILRNPWDKSHYYHLMESILGYRAVVNFLYFARYMMVGLKDEEATLWPVEY